MFDYLNKKLQYVVGFITFLSHQNLDESHDNYAE